ncbi:MAG TPA: hypothetical protein VMX54_10320 [Vicinamibacteria bacterium]|nr:hypothetical protein [Vicinamibacteria bacterium]
MSAGAAAIAPLCLAMLAAGSVAADTAGPTPTTTTAVDRADDLLWKATGSLYLQQGATSADLNLRRQLGTFTAWAGLFHDPAVDTVARLGAEWDLHRGSVLFVPTLQAATNGLKAGQIYSEIGGSTYAIVGASRTNLRPFYNLSWDPNESVQLGLGHHLSHYDKVYAFTIFDVRLHTGQQDTHLLWRRRLSPRLGLTVDGLYKSGRTDSRHFVRAAGLGAYLDGAHWLAKAYYDPYVNFTDHTMFRLGLGAKF